MDDELYRQVKERAEVTGASFSALIQQAVRLWLQPQRNERRAKKFELVTFGPPEPLVPVEIESACRLIETDDLECARTGKPFKT